MLLIGSYPNTDPDWRLVMTAILGDPPDGKTVPYIDSRLNVVHCEVRDITDACDKILGHKRLELWVKDTYNFAVLLYRLHDLGIKRLEQGLDDAEAYFQSLCHYFLGIEDCWVDLRDCKSCSWPHVNLDGVSFGQFNHFVSYRYQRELERRAEEDGLSLDKE